MKKALVLLMLATLTGCSTLEHQQTYKQAAPTTYSKTNKVMVFEYRGVNLHDIYDLIYGDFLIIGKSEFIGPYENPKSSTEFAQSIGADVFVSTSQFKETRTSFVPTITPTSSTSYISGSTASGPFYGTSNNYGTRTTMIPVYIDRYDQSGMYLKNVNHVTPLWEKKPSDFKETEANMLGGNWYNENFDLKLYRSGPQMVGFIDSNPKGKETGHIEDIKMLFNAETGAGLYLMPDRTPLPAQFKVNKFGHLQVDLTSRNESVSFARR